MKRECPRCFLELVPEVVKRGIWKVEIDKCTSCDGIYLDKGELLTLTKNKPLHHLTTDHLGVDSDSELLCPSCGSIMDAEFPNGVEIDVAETRGRAISNLANAANTYPKQHRKTFRILAMAFRKS